MGGKPRAQLLPSDRSPEFSVRRNTTNAFVDRKVVALVFVSFVGLV
jgi:hypothetical protein